MAESVHAAEKLKYRRLCSVPNDPRVLFTTNTSLANDVTMRQNGGEINDNGGNDSQGINAPGDFQSSETKE